jgi:hypothetical protein
MCRSNAVTIAYARFRFRCKTKKRDPRVTRIPAQPPVTSLVRSPAVLSASALKTPTLSHPQSSNKTRNPRRPDESETSGASVLARASCGSVLFGTSPFGGAGPCPLVCRVVRPSDSAPLAWGVSATASHLVAGSPVPNSPVRIPCEKRPFRRGRLRSIRSLGRRRLTQE